MSRTKNATGRRAADQAGIGRQDIWLAIKRSPELITVTDIVAKTGVHRSSVLRYLQSLTAAGYLSISAAPSGKAASWTLVKDIGHHAPRVRRDGIIVTLGDNTGQL